MVSNGDVTGIIDRLVAEGSWAVGARRRQACHLRPPHAQGRKFQAMAKAHEAWVGELLAGVGREDTDTLVRSVGGGLRAPARNEESRPMTWLDRYLERHARPWSCSIIATGRPDRGGQGRRAWRLWYTSFPAPERWAPRSTGASRLHAEGSMLPFAVIETATGKAVGMTTYMNADAANGGSRSAPPGIARACSAPISTPSASSCC